MPANSRFKTRFGVIEVAANVDLERRLRAALRRHGPLTAVEAADLAYWNRPPGSRMSLQWVANASARSATRRALARLRRNGEVEAVRRSGRAFVYDLAGFRSGRG